jgi:hypothetical protein
MQRRQFLATACATGLAAASMQAGHSAEPSDQPHFIDLRRITTPNAGRLETLVRYNGDTASYFTKYGISPFGLFVADSQLNAKEAGYDKKYDSVMFALIPHKNLNSTLELTEKMRNDTSYLESYAAMSQGATSKNPMSTAHEQMLLRCFPEFPEVRVPSLSPGRILQLRMYRSHSLDRNRAKVSQFTAQRGAIDIFADCDIKPVFLSTTFFGSFMPSIIFMLSFESEDHKNDAWAKFVNHPDWKKLAADPKYADTATEIINIFLKPCKGSQI